MPVSLAALSAEPVDGGVLHYRPGSAGAAAAPDVARQLAVTRRRLERLAPELDSFGPHVCLVDPLPDPHEPGSMVTEGALVDPANGAVWLIVVPEGRMESLDTTLALLAASSLPNQPEASVLALGYALAMDGGAVPPGPTPEGPIAGLEGAPRADAARSFVRHLLDRGGEDAVVAVMRASQGRLDEVAVERFGQPLRALEDEWRSGPGSAEGGLHRRSLLTTTVTYVRPYWRQQVEMLALMVLSLAFVAVFPFVLRRLLDSAIPSEDMGAVLRLIGLLAVVFVVSLVADLRRGYVAALTSSSVVRDLRVQMFERLQRQSARWYAARRQGDIATRLFDDVQVVEQGVAAIVRDGTYQLASLLVSGTVLLALNVPIGLIVLAGAPVCGLIYRAQTRRAEQRSRDVQDETGAAMGVATENLGLQPVVKAFGLEDREKTRFERVCSRLLRAQLRLEVQQNLFSLAVNLVAVVLRLGVIAFGAWLILRGRLTLGGLVAVIGVMGDVIEPVLSLTAVGQQMQAASGALSRVDEVLEATPDIRDAEGAVDVPALRDGLAFDGVNFSYTPGRRVLADVDLSIPAGTRVALVGPSGSGKSTILQLVLRMYDPDDGGVTLDGVDLRSARIASLRAQFGVVYQETVLFDASLRDNVALGRPGATDADIVEALRGAELDEYLAALPEGLDTPIGERGGQLSGGQRQRVAIARALVRNPSVLLLDEPTSALDPETEQQVNATLARVAEGRTILTITHRLPSVATYDRILVIAGGRIVESGGHEDLLAASGVYAGMWAEQTGEAAPSAAFDHRAALRRIALFADLDDERLSAIAARFTASELAAGQEVGEADGSLRLITNGRAVVLAPDGDEITVLGPGDAFGVAAALGARQGTRLLAAVPTALLTLPAAALEEVAREHAAKGAPR